MPTEGVSGVYGIECTVNGRLYIGSSANIANRWRMHRYELRRNHHHSGHLQNCWNKYGEDAFRLIVLDECAPERAALLACEQAWLDGMKPELNHCLIAGSRLGVPFTAEQRIALSATRKALGYHHSPETKVKLSAAKMGNQYGRGRVMSSEQKAKLAAVNRGKPSPLRGRPRPPEAAAKSSAAQKGKPRPYLIGRTVSPETRAKIAARLRGNTNGLGTTRSPESVERVRRMHLGQTRSEESRAKMRASRLAYLARQRVADV